MVNLKLQCGDFKFPPSFEETTPTFNDIDIKHTLLQLAYIANNIEMMRLLLESGSDPNAQYDYNVAFVRASGSSSYDPLLILAAASQNVEVVELLIQHGADANVHAKVRYTIHYSSFIMCICLFNLT